MEGDIAYGVGMDAGRLLLGVVMVVVAGLGVIGLAFRFLVSRLWGALDRRLGRIETELLEVDRLRLDIERMRAELPLHYQRRDDAIREYTAINSKLDRLYELIARSFREDPPR